MKLLTIASNSFNDGIIMQTESIRQKKLADQIKQQVSQIIDRKLKDPRKGFITVTRVKVTRDLRLASVYYTTLGDQMQREKSAEALESAKNFIRSEMASNLRLRYIPDLRFFYDDSLDYSEHINELLKKIKKNEEGKD
jgi:ribosome-binding factor A